jgi:hypothetical protein
MMDRRGQPWTVFNLPPLMPVSLMAFEMAAAEMPIAPHVADDRLDG